MPNHCRRRARLSWIAVLCSWPSIVPAGESFFEPFDRFDRSRWYVSDGWANGEWQNCTWSSRNLALEDGVLRLKFTDYPTGERAFSCAEIQTHASFGHGLFEARLRSPNVSGLNAAFFTYIGPVHGKPHDEIDVEILTRSPQQVSLNTYHNGTPAYGSEAELDVPADAAFHVYAFEWSPDWIRWYLDGVLVHETPAGAVLPQTAQKIMASLWGSDTLTDWMGPFEASTGSYVMEIDWISYTAPCAPCQHPASLRCAQ